MRSFVISKLQHSSRFLWQLNLRTVRKCTFYRSLMKIDLKRVDVRKKGMKKKIVISVLH